MVAEGDVLEAAQHRQPSTGTSDAAAQQPADTQAWKSAARRRICTDLCVVHNAVQRGFIDDVGHEARERVLSGHWYAHRRRALAHLPGGKQKGGGAGQLRREVLLAEKASAVRCTHRVQTACPQAAEQAPKQQPACQARHLAQEALWAAQRLGWVLRITHLHTSEGERGAVALQVGGRGAEGECRCGGCAAMRQPISQHKQSMRCRVQERRQQQAGCRAQRSLFADCMQKELLTAHSFRMSA